MAQHLAEFTHNGIRILGYSLAGEESFFVLPELGIAFDVGRAPRDVVLTEHVFLTHGHMDHAAGLAYYFAQREFLDTAPGKLFTPEPLVEPIRRMLRAWADIDGHPPPGEITAVRPGVDVAVRRDLVVRPFEVNHPCRRNDRSVVASLGFSAIEVRNKLVDEFAGLSGPEIVALKNRGIEITRRVEVPLVCYCGDTMPGDFLALPHVREARVLLLECTFLDDDHLGRAKAGNHMHVTDLARIVPMLQNERIVLTHLSRRTSHADAKAHLRRHLGAAMDERIVVFMEQRRRRLARNESSGPGSGPRVGQADKPGGPF